MNEINEKTYPIRKRWFFRQLLPAVTMVPFTLAILYFVDASASIPFELSKLGFLWLILAFFTLLYGCIGILNIRRGAGLRYDFGETAIKIQSVSKKERLIPYDNIKTVYVRKTVFGYTSLIIEDTSDDPTAMNQKGKSIASPLYGPFFEVVGFSGKRAHFPGLRAEDAERLQTFIAEKTKQNSIRVTFHTF